MVNSIDVIHIIRNYAMIGISIQIEIFKSIPLQQVVILSLWVLRQTHLLGGRWWCGNPLVHHTWVWEISVVMRVGNDSWRRGAGMTSYGQAIHRACHHKTSHRQMTVVNCIATGWVFWDDVCRAFCQWRYTENENKYVMFWRLNDLFV